MEASKRWTVKCQDPMDGSEDVIVELPDEVLAELGWSLGDELIVDKTDEGITLKLKSERPTHK